MAVPHMNTFADLGALAQTVQNDADFVFREAAFVTQLVKNFNDRNSPNTRTRHQFNEAGFSQIGESDDLTSQAFTPEAAEVLTPAEHGAQFFITDRRARAEAPEAIMADASAELGLAAADHVSQLIYGDFANLTGGTVGAAGSAMTWGYVMAAIAQVRVQAKNKLMPVNVVLHEYQWFPIAKSASVAGATRLNADQIQNDITYDWYVGTVAGANIYVSPSLPIDGQGDAVAAAFARDALAYDVRKAYGVEAERDASRRGIELNATMDFAHGVWRPSLGVQIVSDASVPQG